MGGLSRGSLLDIFQYVPAGTILPFAGITAPAGWAICDGSTLSRETYSALFEAIGTVHGEGDGSTTFHLPDLRGRMPRGTNSGTGRDPDAAVRTAANPGGNSGDNVGSVQGDSYGSHSHGSGSHSHFTQNFADTGFPDGSGDRTGSYYFMHPARGTNYRLSINSSGTLFSTQGSSETRSKNAYVNFIIKI